MPHRLPYDMSPEAEHRLIRALLQVVHAWSSSPPQPMSWDELVRRMPEECRVSPDVLRAYTIHYNNEGFLRGLLTTDSGIMLEGLTPLGERMLRDEYAIARRDYRLLYLPLALLGLAELIWVVFRYVIRG